MDQQPTRVRLKHGVPNSTTVSSARDAHFKSTLLTTQRPSLRKRKHQESIMSESESDSDSIQNPQHALGEPYTNPKTRTTDVNLISDGRTTCSVPKLPSFVLSEEQMLEPSDIHLSRSIHYNKCENVMMKQKPSIYITNAMRDIVTELITKSKENTDLNVKFVELIRSMIKKITMSVIGKVTTDISDLVAALATEDEQKKTAIEICIMLSFVRNIKDDMVSIKWNVLLKWVTNISKLLNDEIVRLTLKRSLENQEHDVNRDYLEFKNRMEEHIRRTPGMRILERLSGISDICTYILFGVSITKRGNNNFYMDTLVKAIFVLWTKERVFPSENQCFKKNYVSWCLPLAHLIKLNGFGSVRVSEEEKEDNFKMQDYLRMLAEYENLNK